MFHLSRPQSDSLVWCGATFPQVKDSLHFHQTATLRPARDIVHPHNKQPLHHFQKLLFTFVGLTVLSLLFLNLTMTAPHSSPVPTHDLKL
jgi:hypothetical protein